MILTDLPATAAALIGTPRSPMMATADCRRLGRHMPPARPRSSVTILKSKGFSRGHQNAIALSLADRL